MNEEHLYVFICLTFVINLYYESSLMNTLHYLINYYLRQL